MGTWARERSGAKGEEDKYQDKGEEWDKVKRIGVGQGRGRQVPGQGRGVGQGVGRRRGVRMCGGAQRRARARITDEIRATIIVVS